MSAILDFVEGVVLHAVSEFSSIKSQAKKVVVVVVAAVVVVVLVVLVVVIFGHRNLT